MVSTRRAFPATRWSMLLAGPGASGPARRVRLDWVARAYWTPVLRYVKACQKISEEDARDLTQGFFAMLVSRLDFDGLSPARGRFRSYLKVLLRRHLADQVRLRGARVRRAEVPLLPEHHEVDSLDPALDRAWAAGVLKEAMARLRHELERSGRLVYYELLCAYCRETRAGSYDALADRHGLTAHQVRHYLRFARARARHLVRETIRELGADETDLDAEVRRLCG